MWYMQNIEILRFDRPIVGLFRNCVSISHILKTNKNAHFLQSYKDTYIVHE